MTVELKRSKWEVVAQRIALGDTDAMAYRKARYRSKDPHSDANTLLRRHPEIRERAVQLREQMFDRQVDTQLVTRREVISELLENLQSAKEGKLYFDRHGELIATGRDYGAINQALKLIADIEGMIVRRSEQRVTEGDGIQGATPAELLQTIDNAFDKLGFDFDLTQLADSFATGPTEAGTSGNGDVPVPSEVLPTLPETAGTSLEGEGFPIPVVDGREPRGEVGNGKRGSGDAPDGDLPGELEGEDLREGNQSLGRRRNVRLDS